MAARPPLRAELDDLVASEELQSPPMEEVKPDTPVPMMGQPGYFPDHPR
jgi:hypothetical protein